MSWPRLQLLFFTAPLFLSGLKAEPAADSTFKVDMVDVDGNKLNTAGRVSIIVATSQNDIDKARTVGESIPDFCLGNPKFQMVTLLRFAQKHQSAMRAIINAIVRHRLDAEAKALQARYNTNKISRDARADVFSVTDFDGLISSHLGLAAHSTAFQVLLLGKEGQLLKQWTELPSPEELAAELKRYQ